MNENIKPDYEDLKKDLTIEALDKIVEQLYFDCNLSDDKIIELVKMSIDKCLIPLF